MAETGDAVIIGTSSRRFDPYYGKGEGWSKDGYSGWGVGSAVCKLRYNGEKHPEAKGWLLAQIDNTKGPGNVMCEELDKGNYITSCVDSKDWIFSMAAAAMPSDEIEQDLVDCVAVSYLYDKASNLISGLFRDAAGYTRHLIGM